MDRLRAVVPDLPRDAWVLLGGDAVSALQSGVTFNRVAVREAQEAGARECLDGAVAAAS